MLKPALAHCEDFMSNSGLGAMKTLLQKAEAKCPRKCASTQVPHSDKAATKSIRGTTGQSVSVTCNDGYRVMRHSQAVCGVDGTFSRVQCMPTCDKCANFAQFQACLDTVERKCCDEPSEKCTEGQPETCNRGCANVMGPALANCDGFMVDNGLGSVKSLLQKAELKCPPPSCANFGEYSALNKATKAVCNLKLNACKLSCLIKLKPMEIACRKFLVANHLSAVAHQLARQINSCKSIGGGH